MAKRIEEGYQGWSNYETWAVNLHLSSLLYDVATEFNDEGYTGIDLQIQLEDWLEGYLDDMYEQLNLIRKNPFFDDLLRGAIKEVGYREICKSIVDDF